MTNFRGLDRQALQRENPCNLDSEPAGVVIRRVIEIDMRIEKHQAGIRSLSPMERLNQDTSFFPSELNNLPNAMIALPPISSYHPVTPAVTKPRQLG